MWYTVHMQKVRTNPRGRNYLDGTRTGHIDPTVIITLKIPISLKEKARIIGDGNCSKGIRLAIAAMGGSLRTKVES